MRVLVVDDSKLERDALARVLQTTKHRVEPVVDAKAALVSFAREAAQVIVFAGPSSCALELLRKVRAVQGAGHPYFIVIVDKPMPGEIASLYAGGVDDFLRKPIGHEELLGRIDAPCRIRRYAAALLKTEAYDWSQAFDVRQLRSFTDTAAIVANDLGQIIGEDLAVTLAAPKDPTSAALHCASIPMSLATDGLEIRLSIVADETALSALGMVVMGEKLDDSGQRDLLRELANTAGGALKRAYATDNVTLTTGLPEDCAVPIPGESTRWWVARAKGAGATIGFACELREKKTERLPASKLREGMVISSDLRNESGALLIAAGTRLTATSAQRLGGALGERFLVDVLSAA